MLNINKGNNMRIMQACDTLANYSQLVDSFREAVSTMDPEHAITIAIDQCISKGILVEYLQERRSEVISTFLTEWNEEAYRAFLREESREDGMAEGLAEGRAEAQAELAERLGSMVHDGQLDVTTAAQILNCTEEEFMQSLEPAAADNQ